MPSKLSLGYVIAQSHQQTSTKGKKKSSPIAQSTFLVDIPFFIYIILAQRHNIMPIHFLQ